MCYCKIPKDACEKMRSKMHKIVDTFWDKLKSEEENQVNIGLEDLEISINEAALDTIFAHCENNPESTPLVPEQQQELRNRVRSRVRLVHEDAGFPGQKPGPERDPEPEGAHNQSPGDEKPEESFCEWILRCFQETLSRLKEIWQEVQAWVEGCATLVKMVKFIWSEIEKFFSSMAWSSSLFQV